MSWGLCGGLAHAGGEGDEEAIIAASSLYPTQLRIAGVVSRPPDEWGIRSHRHEFCLLGQWADCRG